MRPVPFSPVVPSPCPLFPQSPAGTNSCGVGAIEVCGAFGKEWADKIIAATGNKVAVGYVVHNPEQDELFRQFFAKA